MNATPPTAALALLALLAPPQETPLELAWHPAPGLRLEKRFTRRLDLSLSECRLTVDGAAMPVPDAELDVDRERTLVVTDTYAAPDGARIERSFDRIVARAVSVHSNARESRELEASGSSALEGASVAFRRDPQSGRVSTSIDPEHEAEQALLAGLREDLDLRGLLPAAPVAPGDSWELDAAALADLFEPGGDLGVSGEAGDSDWRPFAVVPGPADEDDEAGAAAGADDATTSAVRATFVGLREVDGASLAAIRVHGRLVAHREHEHPTEDAYASAELRTETLVWRLDGELVWDLAGGHARSLSLAGPVELNEGYRREAEMLESGEKRVYEQLRRFGGRASLELATRVNP